jgi:hypothetical protein
LSLSTSSEAQAFFATVLLAVVDIAIASLLSFDKRKAPLLQLQIK